ncbi:hypothetical protein [Methylobacterium terrae]|nr:hypothetical protein [Methylobacterium terrae]
MPLETFPHDTAVHLRTDEDVAHYIEAVLQALGLQLSVKRADKPAA